jgi:hypothetical protein
MNAQALESVMSELRQERASVSARLDALDLAIANLTAAYGLDAPLLPGLKVARRAPAAKPKRQYQRRAAATNSDADVRRAQLLTVIGKSTVGVTIAEIRKATPAMDAKARSNALSTLKTSGAIQRHGNAWVKAA